MMSATTYILYMCLLVVGMGRSDASIYDGTKKDFTTVPTNIPSGSTQVKLNNNKIYTLNRNGFSKLTSCTHLYLHLNQITLVVDGAFEGLEKLIQLQLQQNKIPSINKNSFRGLSTLNHLYLHTNDLTELNDGTFEYLTSLTYLHLSSNKIEQIDTASFKGLEKLTTLYLMNNKLTSIRPGTFTGLGSITSLRLDGNQLTAIAGNTFKDLQLMRTLYLNSNKLTVIRADAFSGCDSLTHLRAGQNQLETLSSEIFTETYFNKLETTIQLKLRLSNNPFVCDSRIDWLKNGEQQGLFTFNDGSVYYPPSCGNFPGTNWRDISEFIPYTGIVNTTTTSHLTSDDPSLETINITEDLKNHETNINGEVNVAMMATIFVLVSVILMITVGVSVGIAVYCIMNKKLKRNGAVDSDMDQERALDDVTAGNKNPAYEERNEPEGEMVKDVNNSQDDDYMEAMGDFLFVMSSRISRF